MRHMDPENRKGHKEGNQEQNMTGRELENKDGSEEK